MTSKNPLLKNITDYLIEEASAEEDELLGMGDNDEAKEGGEGCVLERDEALIKVNVTLKLIAGYFTIIAVHNISLENTFYFDNPPKMRHFVPNSVCII